tara:strand:+ start:20 stop:625 length:606 start_codon:yes stop_codon:yes gene_type:complete
MSNLLTNNNKKLKKSSKLNNASIYEFNLPAYKSVTNKVICPFADTCTKYCYARKGSYTWKNTRLKYESNYQLSKKDSFINLIQDEINRKRKITHVRVHSSGDYYSPEYLNKWLKIANNNPNIIFYSYTKSIPLVNKINKPSNFIFIYSEGSKVDFLINTKKDRHAKIFNNEKDLLNNGYINASNDDLLALTPNKKVGLIFH